MIRDTPRACFVLVANGQRVAEFATEAAAWDYAEDVFGVLDRQQMLRNHGDGGLVHKRRAG